MENVQYKIEEIRLKVLKLREFYEQEKKRNAILKAENQNLQNEVQDQKRIIASLEDQNKILKIAGSVSLSGTDAKTLKKSIDQYIKEIDNCIRLLSD